MKKVISFDKTLEFPSMIGEITSISLEDELKFTNNSLIEGKLIVVGTYKRTEASRLEEDFRFELPTEIMLTEKLDIETSKIEIDDFYYEIENDDSMICHITILVEGIEVVDFEEIDEALESNEERSSKEQEELCEDSGEVRECDGDIKSDYPEKQETQEKEEISKKQEVEIKKDEVVEMQEEKELEMNNINMELPKIEPRKEEIKEEEENIMTDTKQNIVVNDEGVEVGSLFTSLKDSEETFSTYSVYIVREEETVERIMEKYHVTKEELESYNNLSTITVGSKVIIPMTNE